MSTVYGERRAQPGAVKNKLAALGVGDSFPCHDRLERNKYYSIARRLGIRLQSAGHRITRIQ